MIKKKKVSIDKKVDDTAKSIADALNLGELNDKIDFLNKKLKGFESKPKKSKSKTKRLFGASDVSDSEASELKKQPVEKRIVTFYQAALQNDTAVMKALSEGTPADGGYLFDDEFRKEIIKDVEEQFVMRNLVRIVPMSRDIMTIPKEVNTVKVYDTKENAVKTTRNNGYGFVQTP